MFSHIFFKRVTFISLLTSLLAMSCSKNSDNPSPASEIVKPAPPDVNKRLDTLNFPPIAGTGRPPTQLVPVVTPTGSVNVLDPQQQRNNNGNSTGLDNLLGLNDKQLRMSQNSRRTTFGWYLTELTVNDVPYTRQQIIDSDHNIVVFFNCDSSGYYWQFNFRSNKWSWGTWGIDNTTRYIAFDFDKNKKPNRLYKLVRASPNRKVVSSTYDVDGDGTLDNVIIGLNAYDLNNNKFNGQFNLGSSEQLSIGTWKFQSDSGRLLTVKNNGVWQVSSPFALYSSYGSWIIDSVGSQPNNFIMYACFYDKTTPQVFPPKVVSKKYSVNIYSETINQATKTYMNMRLLEKSDTSDPGVIGNITYFVK